MPAGDVAVISVSEFIEISVADVLPNRTEVAPSKPDPVIVTSVPPVLGP